MNKEFISRIDNRINQYNTNEKFSKPNFSTFPLSWVFPETFISSGFATNMENGFEAWRYLDTMQEFRIQEYYNLHLLKFLTHEELDLINKIALSYSKYSLQFNRNTVPIGINHMLSSLPTLRALKTLKSNEKKKLKILEIGGGSSLLGQMCHHLGFCYSNFDIVQSLSVHNISIYEELYKENFFNFASIPYSKNRKLIIENEKNINFIPWWHFLNKDINLPSYDIVIMNHCFFEIKFNCLKFIFTRLNENQNSRQKLIVSKWGSGRYSNFNNKDLLNLEKEFNFKREFLDSEYKLFSDQTLLLSFERPKNKALINDFLIPEVKYNKKTFNFIKKFTPNMIKKQFYIIKRLIHIVNRDINKPRILGKYKLAFNTKKNFPDEKKLNYNDLINLINKLETKFGKSVFTEDELLGHYIKSRKHH